MVVAAPWADNIAGMVYVYEPNGRSWSMRGKLVSPHPEHLAEFGRALAVSGSRVLVGVPVRGGGSKRCGTAYAYTKSSSNFWRLREQVVDPGCSYNDKFGFAVALQGRTAIIGAPLENQADGAAYVLTLP